MKYIYFKLNYHFQKNLMGQNALSSIGPACWKIYKKTIIFNTFRHKINYYYLINLFYSNLCIIHGFYYAMVNFLCFFVCLFVCFLACFCFRFYVRSSSVLAFLQLNESNGNRSIHLSSEF